MKRFIKKTIIAFLISAIYFPAAFSIDISPQELFENSRIICRRKFDLSAKQMTNFFEKCFEWLNNKKRNEDQFISPKEVINFICFYRKYRFYYSLNRLPENDYAVSMGYPLDAFEEDLSFRLFMNSIRNDFEGIFGYYLVRKKYNFKSNDPKKIIKYKNYDKDIFIWFYLSDAVDKPFKIDSLDKYRKWKGKDDLVEKVYEVFEKGNVYSCILKEQSGIYDYDFDKIFSACYKSYYLKVLQRLELRKKRYPEFHIDIAEFKKVMDAAMEGDYATIKKMYEEYRDKLMKRYPEACWDCDPIWPPGSWGYRQKKDGEQENETVAPVETDSKK